MFQISFGTPSINANIDRVIQYICGFDIRLSDIFSIVYAQKDLTYFMSTLVGDAGDFFNKFYVEILNSAIRPILITNIRLAIQNSAIERDSSEQFEENEIE